MKQYILKITSNRLTEKEIDAKVVDLEMHINSIGILRAHIDTLVDSSSIAMVKEFHQVFGHEIAEQPRIPTQENMNFRRSFIDEELQEIAHAYNERDLVSIADGLGDLQYVLDGWFLNAGLQDKKQAIMEEIHRSNMTKACKTEQEAKDTIYNLTNPNPPVTFAALINYHTEQHGNYWIVYRSSDRKVMKSINYQPPNLKDILST